MTDKERIEKLEVSLALAIHAFKAYSDMTFPYVKEHSENVEIRVGSAYIENLVIKAMDIYEETKVSTNG